MDLQTTSAVVTGAASGLGQATARALAERGVAVTGFDLRAGESIEGVRYEVVDVTDAEAVSAAVKRAAQDAPLRVAVNLSLIHI